jgi:hypothetical protein
VDFDQYVAARYGRLIEHAVLLGCAEGEAGTCVDRVLVEQRKAIGRAEDPDPLVHEALERAVEGTPEPRRRTGPLVALGVVGVAVAVAVALTYRPPPEPMPSLFALDGPAAQRLLEDQGYDVVLRPARACEPEGLVLGSEPPAGQPVPSCEALYGFRSDAWQFVAFALGGPAPEFARTVTVAVDTWEPWHLDHVAAVDPSRWGDLMETIKDAARTQAPTATGMPRLNVRTAMAPLTLCGVPHPDGTQGRQALRIEIDPRPEGAESGCPLTIDLYRSSDHAIDGVVVYTPKDLDQDVGLANPTRLRPGDPEFACRGACPSQYS